MKSDSKLRSDIEKELEWEPRIDERRLGVSVVDGIVTLTGDVASFSENWHVERTVERVAGVLGVANELTVRVESERSDADIAESATEGLRWNVAVPSDCIKVEVVKGWLSLHGEVDWDYQRRAAEDSVRHLRGVTGLSNLITIKPRVDAADLQNKIEEAFQRGALVDAKRIAVQAGNGVVTMQGTVRSIRERNDAEAAAWAAPGVHRVHNHLKVVADPLGQSD